MRDNIGTNPPDDVVEFHKADLIARASVLARNHPGLRLVALVAEADAPEAASLSAAQAEVLRAPDGSVAVLVTRQSAKDLLSQATPALLDWLEDEGNGPHRKLPVIHAARGGMRTTSIEYEVAD